MRLFPESTFPFATINDCGEVVTGSTPSKGNSAYWGGQVPFVTPAQLGSQLPIMRADEYVTNEGAKRGRLLPEGSVLVCCIGSLGKTGVAGTPLISNQQINSIIFDPNKVDERYGYYTARCLTPLLEHFAPSTTIKIVKKSTFAQIEIPLPPLAKQKRIAAILDAADALRAKRRESLAQLDTLLQSTFLDMFGDPVTNPKGWEVVPLGKICDVRDGTHDSPKYQDKGHPLLTSKNFKGGRIDFESANLISVEDFRQINKRSKVDVGDLVMPMIGTIGNPVLVEDEPFFAIKNVALIKFGKSSPNNRFIRALLCSHYFDHITSKANRGGTQKFVALKDLRGMPVPLPPLDLQRRFAIIVEAVAQQKTRLRAHLAELDTLFASLQSRAFNGEL